MKHVCSEMAFRTTFPLLRKKKKNAFLFACFAKIKHILMVDFLACCLVINLWL